LNSCGGSDNDTSCSTGSGGGGSGPRCGELGGPWSGEPDLVLRACWRWFGRKVASGAASKELKDVLSAIVRKEWNSEVEAFGRTIQLHAMSEDMNNGAIR